MSKRHFFIALLAFCVSIAASPGCTKQPPQKHKTPDISDRDTDRAAANTEDNLPILGAEVLDRMVIAYRKALRYADAGTVHFIAESGGKKIIDETANYSLTFERPNKIRLQAYQVMLVSDGEKIYGSMEDLPNQIVVKQSPIRLTLKNLFADRMLGVALTRGIAGTMPQLVLLLADEPMKGLIGETDEKPKLIEPGKIDDRQCYRVELRRTDGLIVFWVDQESYVLRRVEFPTNDIQRDISREMPVDKISLTADFSGAKIDHVIDEKAFKFAVPEGAEVVKFFVPPNTAQLLGKRSPALKLVDLNGKTVTLESLSGKVVVLDFWATWCGPCRISLPNLEKVYQKFKGNEKVAFYAVSRDVPNVSNKELTKTFQELKVNVPIVRDAERADAALKFSGIPALFIIGPDGVVQDFEIGMNPNLADILPEKINKLLAGEKIFEKPLREYEEKMKEYGRMLEKAAEEDAKTLGGPTIVEDRKLPETKTAVKSDPEKMKLSPLWKCLAVKLPANVISIGGGKKPARLAVVESWKSIAEVGLDGKLIATHKLDLENDEVISTLRCAAGADGRQYIAAFLTSQQRCHILDEDWKVVASYPQDALKNRHSGITDVQLGDLDGNGNLELCVSYWGIVGVQAASLDGKRLWSNRLMSNVLGMAVGPADEKGRHSLICANGGDQLKVLDDKGEVQKEIVVRDRSIQWIASASLTGDGKTQLCAISARQLGENVAIGLSPTGEELWNYPLPVGVPQKPIDPVISGRLAKTGPGSWILPGPDGSVHFVSADGKPFDKFNYGTLLQGLAAVEIDGRPAIVISSEKGIEAFKID